MTVDKVPTEIEQDDVTCRNFWIYNKIPCGRGATVEEAINDLINILCFEPEHIKAIHKIESEEHKNRVQIKHPVKNILKKTKPEKNCGLPLKFK